jgi:putative membrane protein
LRRAFKYVGAAVLALTTAPAWCASESARDALTEWTWPPLVVLALLLTGVLYALGISKMSRRGAALAIGCKSVLCFAAGWISLVIALDSPIHELGEQLFWVHMTQHELLMLICAPLLVLGRPLVPLLFALPESWRAAAASVSRTKPFRTAWSSLSSAMSAWFLSALGLWIWHAPSLFDQTLHSDFMHAAQHTTFLVTALLFWWPLVNHTRALGYGSGIAYVFTTALHTSILGALLTFAPRPWYSSYSATAPVWHLTALQDQQLGGLIMWIPAGTLLLIITLVLLFKWMNESQTRWEYTRAAEVVRLVNGGIR